MNISEMEVSDLPDVMKNRGSEIYIPDLFAFEKAIIEGWKVLDISIDDHFILRGFKNTYRIPYGKKYGKRKPVQHNRMGEKEYEEFMEKEQRIRLQKSEDFANDFETFFKNKDCEDLIIVSSVQHSLTGAIQGLIRRGLAKNIKVAVFIPRKWDFPKSNRDIFNLEEGFSISGPKPGIPNS